MVGAAVPVAGAVDVPGVVAVGPSAATAEIGAIPSSASVKAVAAILQGRKLVMCF